MKTNSHGGRRTGQRRMYASGDECGEEADCRQGDAEEGRVCRSVASWEGGRQTSSLMRSSVQPDRRRRSVPSRSGSGVLVVASAGGGDRVRTDPVRLETLDEVGRVRSRLAELPGAR